MADAQCTAKSKRTGVRCLRPPRIGAQVCHQHGGGAPQVRRKAAERVIEQQAAAAVSKFGRRQAITDPLTALGEVAGEMVAVKDWLRERVEEISGSLRTLDDKSSEQMRAEFSAYTGMLNSVVGALATIGKLNIDERMARIEEAKVAIIVEALRVGFTAAGVTGEAYQRGMMATTKHLRSASRVGA